MRSFHPFRKPIVAAVRTAALGAILGLGLANLGPASESLSTGAAIAFAADAAPDANQIIGQMKAALEPAKSSVRRMTMTVHQEGESRQFELVQARKHLADGDRSLTILLAPEDAKGLAYLVAEKKPGETENHEWLYMPTVRRVRELVPAENYTTFLGSDLSYGDLGFVDVTTTNKLLGVETIDGKKQYRVESIPGATTKQWYYAKIVTWIDAETLLPVKREFYSPSGLRFKVESFRNVSRVDGIPTPFAITMENIPARTSTDLAVADVAYGVDIPDEYFGPDKLSSIANLAFWSQTKPAGATAP